MDLEQFNELEKYCKKRYVSAVSIIHRFEHIGRVANGAVWFVEIRNGTERQKELAYVAGLLHDIIRPNTEKVDHATASAEESKKILTKFKFSKKEISLIVEAVANHRKVPKKWNSILHSSVFLADKLLEQLGPYAVFRRCLYAGEIIDYQDWDQKYAIVHRFIDAGAKTKLQYFPKWTYPLHKYQKKLEDDFLDAYMRDEDWAKRLGEKLFQNGRDKKLSMDEAIKGYEPKFKKDKAYLKETIEYIEGKKFEEYEKLLSL